MRILILGEQSNVAAHLGSILPTAGHDVLGPVATLEEALKVVDGAPPTLALLNFSSQSQSNGLGIARLLREKWGTQLIIVSADHPTPGDGREIALGYLKMPLDHGMVLDSLAAVEDLLAGRLPRWMPRALRLIGLPKG
jgi:two-component system, response regulator PdtaR